MRRTIAETVSLATAPTKGRPKIDKMRGTGGIWHEPYSLYGEGNMLNRNEADCYFRPSLLSQDLEFTSQTILAVYDLVTVEGVGGVAGAAPAGVVAQGR